MQLTSCIFARSAKSIVFPTTYPLLYLSEFGARLAGNNKAQEQPQPPVVIKRPLRRQGQNRLDGMKSRNRGLAADHCLKWRQRHIEFWAS